MIAWSSGVKNTLRSSFVLLLGAALTGCALEPVPPCPNVRIDSNTAGITVFRAGGGSDITDIAYQAEIVSFEGTCAFDDEGVEMVMDMDIMVSGGPSAEPGEVELYYFVAIPRFHPDPTGKKIFMRRHDVPGGGARRERITESNIRVFIPLEDRLIGAAYDVYLGFQLTDEQLEYNRAQRR